MKTTGIDFSNENQTNKDKPKMLPEAKSPLRSVRPQKSMVRVKSLRPKRMSLSRRVAVKKNS